MVTPSSVQLGKASSKNSDKRNTWLWVLLAKEDMLLAKEDMLLVKEDDVTRKGRRCYSQRKIMSVPSGRGQGQKKRQKGKQPKTEEQTKGCGTDSAGFRSVGFQS